MAYRKEAKKAFEICMNRFAFNGCAKMLKKLIKRTRLPKDEETTYLTQLYE
jgi:hypothetical protein